MYIKEYEFRYGDLDVNNNIRISTVIDVLQDISISHTSSVGYDGAKLAEMKIAWLLEGWRIRFCKPLHGNSPVTVKTGIMSMKACESDRGYEIWQDGELKIVATADWFPINTERRRIVRISPEFTGAYESVNEADNGLKYERFKPETDTDVVDSRTVELRDLDANNHMNNVKSAEIALCCLEDASKVTELTIRYRKELVRDEQYYICTKKLESGYYVELKNADGDACVMVMAT